MKLLLPLALLATSSAFAQKLNSVPFYFSVTEEAHSVLKDKSWKKISVKEVQTDKAFLRGYHFADTSAAGRRKAMKELQAKGVIQTGDIVLSMRPEWEKSIPYAHVQMGVSHAGLAWVEGGVVRNLDMPLDSDYNGSNLSGAFDGKHYLATNYLQILRPRNLSATKKKNLESWILELRKNLSSIRGKGLLRFNPDYFAAKFDTYGRGDAFVTTLARIIQGKNTSSTDLTMFCSEFAWAMLSLSNCSPSDADIAGSTSDARCVDPVFNAMALLDEGKTPGLTTGPLQVLEALDVSSSQKSDLMNSVFEQGEMNGLSSGHRALATNPMIGALIGALQGYYPATLSGNRGMAQGIAAKVNAGGGKNYSPTSFLINSMLDETDPERTFDYVATISFGN